MSRDQASHRWDNQTPEERLLNAQTSSSTSELYSLNPHASISPTLQTRTLGVCLEVPQSLPQVTHLGLPSGPEGTQTQPAPDSGEGCGMKPFLL